jgi:site-specific recombinase XerD
MLAQVLEQAELNDEAATLRPAITTHLIRQGVDVRIAQGPPGHAGLQTTAC